MNKRYSEADEIEQTKRERAKHSKSLESVKKKEKAFEAIAFEMQRDF